MSKPKKDSEQLRRRPGRPKRNETVVGPAVLEEIGRRWLQGETITSIAASLSLDHGTVRYHLDTHIRPQWHEQARSMLDIDMAKVTMIEEIAWERFYSTTPGETIEQIEKGLVEDKRGNRKLKIIKQAMRSVTKTGEAGWLEVIQWCIEFRARIHAHYAPSRVHHDIGGELRVAGMTPSELDAEMVQRLMRQIAERRAQRIRLDGGDACDN